MEISCADCGCLPSECETSASSSECPNCRWEECCCGRALYRLEDFLNNKAVL